MDMPVNVSIFIIKHTNPSNPSSHEASAFQAKRNGLTVKGEMESMTAGEAYMKLSNILQFAIGNPTIPNKIFLTTP